MSMSTINMVMTGLTALLALVVALACCVAILGWRDYRREMARIDAMRDGSDGIGPTEGAES